MLTTLPQAAGACRWRWWCSTRHAVNGREAAFWQPPPAELLPLARRLHDIGVRHLLVVMPHVSATPPEALKAGLASLDEQAVAALGFGIT